jgi:hypothetical protein
MKKRRIKYLGGKVHTDDKGRMFKEVGNARIYLSPQTVSEIEARKRQKE